MQRLCERREQRELGEALNAVGKFRVANPESHLEFAELEKRWLSYLKGVRTFLNPQRRARQGGLQVPRAVAEDAQDVQEEGPQPRHPLPGDEGRVQRDLRDHASNGPGREDARLLV